jgi:hypothetical protein
MAMAPGIGTRAACRAAGVPQANWYRRHRATKCRMPLWRKGVPSGRRWTVAPVRQAACPPAPRSPSRSSPGSLMAWTEALAVATSRG